jgi:RyR domain
LVHAARMWRVVRAGPFDPLHITVVDQEATAKVQALSQRFPRLGEDLYLLPHDLDVGSPEFERATFFTDAEPSITITYIDLGDDSVALSAGLGLFERSRTQSMPVVICTRHEKGLGLLLKGLKEPAGGDRVKLFGVLERAWAPEILLGGTNELLARAIHAEYRRDQARAGQTVDSNPAAAAWADLPEPLKESNRQQADHIGRKLEAIGCGITALTDWDASPVQFEVQEIERMARMEHARWMSERKSAGWRYDPGPKDFGHRTSSYLVDWESLPERVQDYDRNTVRELPMLLARAGLAVFRCNAENSLTTAVPESPGPQAHGHTM